MKTVINCENPSSNPLQNACCDIQEAACDSANCSVSRKEFLRIMALLFKITVGMIGCQLFLALN
jgi:hypothetical protein